MSVHRDEVERIAGFARLDLEGDEVARLTDEMTRILEYAELLRTAGAGRYSVGVGDDVSEATRSAMEDPRGSMGGAGPRSGEADPLAAHPSVFAPAWDDGFFIVPPLPGVKADDDA